MKIFNLLILILFFSLGNQLIAQTEIDLSLISNSAFFSGNGKYHFSLGEPVTQDFIANERNSITSGFYQDRLFLTSLSQEIQHVDINIYPNPVSEVLTIDYKEEENLKLILFDIEGHKISESNVDASIQLDLSNYTNGTYILRIINSKGLANTHRIIKIK